ncbi:hypothetical protein JAAARDRAFT_40245 [Jaapia argillacea MUCL 33604]|uniref:Uncharacterized protein n=1 Tax=Jaapia argillacea MUCL 33604 TaxID=933084 RepID=A0A067PBQ8_9AGAM|nr:hypothetical protein JAAARDRAFT_40245 [Jaapia argillacea MUCL 33604]
MSVLSAFKLKEFDLEPVYASWESPPTFNGNPKTDLPVETWLDQIKAGCVEHKVPEEYWHKVAQHYMGPKAIARLEEFKRVLYQMNGGSYRWSWKKFRLAMTSMGWDIEVQATEPVEVKSKPSGSWWVVRKKSDKKVPEKQTTIDDTPPPTPPKSPVRSKSAPSLKRSLSRHRSSSTLSGASITAEPEEIPPVPSVTKSAFWTRNKDDSPLKPELMKAMSEPIVQTCSAAAAATKPKPPVRSNTVADLSPTSTVATKPRAPTRSNTMESTSTDSEAVTTIAQAPAWLLQACHALDILTQEHPKVMSTLSAILITAGSIPSIPAISAGAGGAFLASSAAHAIGSICVGIGSIIKAQQGGQVQTTTGAPAAGGAVTATK